MKTQDKKSKSPTKLAMKKEVSTKRADAVVQVKTSTRKTPTKPKKGPVAAPQKTVAKEIASKKMGATKELALKAVPKKQSRTTKVAVKPIKKPTKSVQAVPKKAIQAVNATQKTIKQPIAKVVVAAKSAVKQIAAVPVSANRAVESVAVVLSVAPKSTRKGAKGYMAVPPVAIVPTHSPDAAKASYSTQSACLDPWPTVPAVVVKKDPKLANNWQKKPAHTLSDAEVLSMPDAQYMNDAQLAFFRHRLVVLKQGILDSAGETTEHLREDAAVVPDPADRATIEEEHALELRTRDRERKLLKKIEQSLVRIDTSEYGYCEETGEPIGVPRLLARPTASLSLEAQQRRELKQKMFGD